MPLRFVATPTAGRQADPLGSVYYLLVGDLIKVGWTRDVANRLVSYPPHSELLAVEPGVQSLEAQRHRELRADLSHGREWYHRTAQVEARIASVVAEHGEPTPMHYPHSRRKRRHQYPVTVTHTTA